MASLYNRITHQRVFIWLVTFLGIALAPVLGYFTCTLGWTMDLIILGLILVATWAFIARDRWWVPFPAALALGGTFYYKFKIPIHEMALLLCLLPLLLAVATRWQRPIVNRGTPALSVFLLTAYLFLHLLGSLIYNKVQGLGGVGNVVRCYMDAFWPFIFFYAYYFFGNSKYMRTAFMLMYCALIVRVTLGILGFFFPSFLYIPGINYVPPSASLVLDNDLGGGDLRGSCPALLTAALCYMCISKSFVFRAWNLFLILCCSVAVLLGGGRIGAAGIIVAPLSLAIISRRYILILFLASIAGGILIFINLSPQSIDSLPKPVQRSLSGLIIKKGKIDMQIELQASNEWHAQLQEAGLKRWTESLRSILIGNGIRPFSQELWSGGTFEDQIKVAIATSRFESALWTVLATLGLVGFVLYLNVFRFLLADSFPLLWKHGVHDYTTIFAFYTSIGILMFLAIGYFSGYYPTSEIMMGLFAKTLHDDEKNSSSSTLPMPPIPHHFSPAEGGKIRRT